ncbi:MAG: apolipoprotein N-acyltransferase [Acidobacteriaceae bacterium]
MRSIPLRLWAFALLSAILQILPFPIAGPVPFWRRLFCWFCLIPLLYALLEVGCDGKPLRLYQAALLAYASGVLWYAGNCYWIYRTMHLYGNIPVIASFGILILFSLYLGLYLALFGVLLAALRKCFSRTTVLLCAPFLWVAVELARARITGFPWDLLGYTQVDNLTLTRLAPWTGVMGISFVIAAINSLWLLRTNASKRHLRYLPASAALIFVVVITLAAHRNQSDILEPAQSVATLLQENLTVGNESPASRETKQQMLASFSQLSLHPTTPLTLRDHQVFGTPLQTPSQIIIWPESPADFVDTDPILRQAVSSLAKQANAAVIVNDITLAYYKNGRPKLYNSASFFLPNGSYAGRYDKMHLVPFGEYTPYKPLFFFVGSLLDGLDFIPGTHSSVFTVGDKRYGAFICYESIFGNDLRHFPLEGAQVLVNISDDGWYGDTSAPWEHLDMVRMRAIENDRWLVRATNTGVTADIDPYGRIIATIPRHIRTSVQVPFGFRTRITFYSRYGDWFAWLCAVVTALALAAGVSLKRRTAETQVN